MNYLLLSYGVTGTVYNLAFAEALRLNPTCFNPYNGQPISVLRSLHYPETTGLPEAGQQRAGTHSDYGSLTILLPPSGTSGLQIMHNGV